jgi:hypothetical protein
MQRIHPTVNYGLFTKFRNRLFLMVFEHRWRNFENRICRLLD